MYEEAKVDLAAKGFTIIPDVFSGAQLTKLAETVESIRTDGPNIRQSADVFAIRSLLQEVPVLSEVLWQQSFNELLDKLLGPTYEAVKAIYFDKPAESNWAVPWHQDLLISVDRQQYVPDWTNWTKRHGQWSAQPTASYLSRIYTVRIHLDDCDETNGALKVLPGTHNQGILSDADIQALDKTIAVSTNVPKGGLLIMRPLLVHASAKSSSPTNRRVIHLELAENRLPKGIQWREYSPRRTKTEFSELVAE